LVGDDLDQDQDLDLNHPPTYLPEGEKEGEKEPASEQQRSLALLTDSEVGIDLATAKSLAERYSFETIRAHLFAVLEDIRRGKVRSVYVLPSRLQRGGSPQVLEEDKRSGLWLRHSRPEEEVEARRKKYIPPGFEDVIIS
jgi:hypothetical protein